MNIIEWVGRVSEQIIRSIENSSRVGVLSIREKIDQSKNDVLGNTFSVNVKNPVTKVDVKGTVVVGNQNRLEKRVEELLKPLRDITKAVSGLKAMEVTNFPKYPEFPKEVRVSNLSNKTELINIGLMVDALGKVQKSVEKMKLDPTIKVEAPKIPAPIVNVPKQDPPIVKVTEREIDLSPMNDMLDFWKSLSGSAKKSLSVRLTDGDKFYKAMERLGEIMTANSGTPFQYHTGDGARPLVNRNNEVQVTVNDTWDVNDTDKASATVTYFGEESVDGKWRVRKVVKSGVLTSVRHATIRNNPEVTNYIDAWAGRTTLVFSYAKEAL